MEGRGENILYNIIIIIIIITGTTSRLKGDYNVRKWNMLLGIGVLNPTDAIGHWAQGLILRQAYATGRINQLTQRMLLGIGVLNPTAAAAPTLEILEQAPAGFRDSERDRRLWTLWPRTAVHPFSRAERHP